MENKSIFVLTDCHEIMLFPSREKCMEELREVYSKYEFDDVEELMDKLDEDYINHDISISEYRLSDIFDDE